MYALPLVSVLMPVYNGEKYLSEAIDSILNQTYTNFEFLIINDGSTDGTEGIILSYSDPRIVYIKNEENIKLIASLNKGIDLAKGKYIARMDSDDIALENRFEVQVKFMESNPNVGLCGSGVSMTYSNGKQTDVKYPETDSEIRLKMLQDSPFAHPTVIIRNSTLIDNKLTYNPEYIHIEDYQLWYKLSLHSTLYNINQVLLKYRVHDSQISQIHRSEQLELNKKLLTNLFSLALPMAKENDCILLQRFFTAEYSKKWDGESILKISGLLNDFIKYGSHNYNNKEVIQFIRNRFWEILCINTTQGQLVLKAYKNQMKSLKKEISFISKVYFYIKCYLNVGTNL